MSKKTRAAREAARQAIENRRAEARGRKQRWQEDLARREEIVQTSLARKEVPPAVQIRRDMDIDRRSNKGEESHGLRTETPTGVVRDRATRLLAALEEKKVRFLTLDFCPHLTNVVQAGPWVRPIEDWTPVGKSPVSQFRSLVAHLFCAYPVPHFLYGVFDLRPRDFGTVEWLEFFAGVGNGGSVYKLAQKYISIPMTRRMATRFMLTTGNDSLLSVLRRVQVEEVVEDDASWARRLHVALMGTRLGRPGIHKAEEGFWETVIRWFGRQAMLDPNQVGPLIDYISHARGENPDWSIKGRTVAALTRDMEQWHGVLQKLQKVHGNIFTPSGLKPGRWLVKRTDKANCFNIFTVTEILSTKALGDEGREMKHCVYSYGRSIESGGTSIWTLRRHEGFNEDYFDEAEGKMKTRLIETGSPELPDERLVTIEVFNRDRAIVQVRGKMNRAAKSNEQSWVQRWAGENGLQIRSGMWGRWA